MLRQFRLARNGKRVLINSRKVICLMETEQSEDPVSTIVTQAPRSEDGVLTVDVKGSYDTVRRKLRWGF